ncbi:MAG: SpoIIE family protein phosphatase [Bdellovibrionales bacterium]|nr:SpoIIE family protein phosphatase [Bdellovibrionales bacterium]
MNDLRITVVADTVSTEKRWIDALKKALGDSAATYAWSASHDAGGDAWGSVLFVDASHTDLERTLKAIDRHGRSVFLIWPDDSEVWGWDTEVASIVDDLVVYPFRRTELESKFRLHEHLRMWSEVGELHRSFNELLSALDEDVKLAERLQKARLPNRYPAVRGLQIRSRFLAGLKGGDHFDLAESKDNSRISILMSDSSSYGLSSAFLSTLMRMTMKLSRDEARPAAETVKLIADELLLGLKEKDRLAIFYGILNRKDFRFRYLHLGQTAFFHARKGKGFEIHAAHGDPLSLANADPTKFGEKEVVLEPEDRIVLLSDGFIEACGGLVEAKTLLDPLRDKDSADLTNELVFRVKKKMVDPEDLPPQDCTSLVFDVDAKLLRLA